MNEVVSSLIGCLGADQIVALKNPQGDRKGPTRPHHRPRPYCDGEWRG